MGRGYRTSPPGRDIPSGVVLYISGRNIFEAVSKRKPEFQHVCEIALFISAKKNADIAHNCYWRQHFKNKILVLWENVSIPGAPFFRIPFADAFHHHRQMLIGRNYTRLVYAIKIIWTLGKEAKIYRKYQCVLIHIYFYFEWIVTWKALYYNARELSLWWNVLVEMSGCVDFLPHNHLTIISCNNIFFTTINTIYYYITTRSQQTFYNLSGNHTTRSTCGMRFGWANVLRYWVSGLTISTMEETRKRSLSF